MGIFGYRCVRVCVCIGEHWEARHCYIECSYVRVCVCLCVYRTNTYTPISLPVQIFPRIPAKMLKWR